MASDIVLQFLKLNTTELFLKSIRNCKAMGCHKISDSKCEMCGLGMLTSHTRLRVLISYMRGLQVSY